jgi:Holliday junction DNA helicase RuvB
METFSDFVGNKDSIELVNLLIHDALEDNNARLPDMAFLGPAGHGKTSLARLVAKELGRRLIEINATTLKDPFQLRGYIINDMPPEGAVIFVDECHALKKPIQTNLLSATESPRKLHTSDKKEIYRDSLPQNFSFIFATTRRSYIIPELYSRLDIVEFDEYSLDEKCEIVIKHMKKKHNIRKEQFDVECVIDIAGRSRSARAVIRSCNKIVQNMNRGDGKLTKSIVNDTFRILGIDKNGLTKLDRKMLKYLSKRSAPVGLETLSILMRMPKKDVQGEVEPFLLRQGYVNRMSSGRMITKEGRKVIGVSNGNR